MTNNNSNSKQVQSQEKGSLIVEEIIVIILTRLDRVACISVFGSNSSQFALKIQIFRLTQLLVAPRFKVTPTALPRIPFTFRVRI